MIRMRFIPLAAAGILVLAACGGSSARYARLLGQAEAVVHSDPDSALSIIDEIEPSEIGGDSLKAKYYYLTALAHKNQNRPSAADSLIRFSYNYYKGKDLRREVESATLCARQMFITGDHKGAFALLDSIADISGLPDSLLINTLKMRVSLDNIIENVASYNPRIRRLLEIDKDPDGQKIYRFWLYLDYLYRNNTDSALIILNDLIAKAEAEKDDIDRFNFLFEKIGTLEESGRYEESKALADWLLENAPGSSVQHYLHLWKAVNWFNLGRSDLSMVELSRADSCASGISEAERGYYDSFASMLRTVAAYKDAGALKIIQVAKNSNRQKEYYKITEALRRESELNAFRLESKRAALKARSERQAATIIILVLTALLAGGVALWAVRSRRRKQAEAEERAEALHSMVEELKTSRASDNDRALRHAMLQQLGIIKMVAEVPTQQNREMLRRISSINGDTGGSLVNWQNVYHAIDSLYSGFYTWLHERYGAKLTDKEEQIIVLMLAGFSTKEIGVITGQTAATIYVRKSSVRRKLELPEKEDIISCLKEEKKKGTGD